VLYYPLSWQVAPRSTTLPLLPVISRTNLQHLEGVVSLDDVLRVYRASFTTGDAGLKAP
jgi:hypothetical protein